MKSILFSAFLATLAAAQSILEVVDTSASSETPEFTILKSLVIAQPDVVGLLKDSSKQLTVFAPTDAAFREAGINPNTTDKNLALNVLKYHVLASKLNAANIPAKAYPNTLLNDEKFVQLPNDAGQVLAVTKEGSSVMIRFGLKPAASVITADVKASNGVIHVIDTVLMPPLTASKTVEQAKLNTLGKLLTQAKLVETIEKIKGVTIFAPTDEAFAKYDLSKLSSEQVSAVLKNHVLQAIAYSGKLPKSAQTVQGSSVKIETGNSTVKINQAKVLTADVLISNGVVHVINDVLLPNGYKVDGKVVIGTTEAEKGSAGSIIASMGYLALSAVALLF